MIISICPRKLTKPARVIRPASLRDGSWKEPKIPEAASPIQKPMQLLVKEMRKALASWMRKEKPSCDLI